MPDHLGEVSRRQAALRLAGHFQPRPETWSVGFRVARAGSGLFQGQCSSACISCSNRYERSMGGSGRSSRVVVVVLVVGGIVVVVVVVVAASESWQ